MRILSATRLLPALLRAVGAVAVLLLGWVLAPSTASACDVGVGYKPTISFRGNNAFGSTCSAGTSLTGVAILAVLVAVAVVALASTVLKRALVQAESLGDAENPGAADRVLNSYLESAGLGDVDQRPPE